MPVNFATQPIPTVEMAFSPPFGSQNILTNLDYRFFINGGGTWVSTGSAGSGIEDGGFLPTTAALLGAISGIYPAIPGLTYTVMAQFGTQGGSVGITWDLQIQWRIGSTWTAPTTPITAFVPPSGAPTMAAGFVTAPPGANAVQVLLGTSSAVAGNSSILYEVLGVGLVNAPVATLPVGGAPPAIPAWTDITDHVQAISTKAGAQHELSQVEASTLELILDNRDGRFNTWNTAGPYGPPNTTTGLVAQMPVKVTGTIPAGCPGAGNTYPVFYGFINSWKPTWKNPMSPDIAIEATDMLGILAAADFNSTQYQTQLAFDGAVCLYRLNDPGPASNVVNPVPAGYAVDQLGQQALGVYTNAVTFGTTGPFITDTNTAVSFAGGELTITEPIQWQSLATPFSWTAECWVQFPTPPTGTIDQTIWHNNLGPTLGGIALVWHSLTNLLGVVRNGIEIFTTLVTNVDDGNWHYTALAYTAVSDAVMIYVDELQYGPHFPSVHLTISGGSWTVGNDATGMTPMTGNVANFALYTGILSPTIIANHFAIGDLGGTVVTSGVRIGEILAVGNVPAAQQALAAGISEIQPISTVGLAEDAAINNGTVTASNLVGTKILDYIQQVSTTECGLVFQTPAGVFTFFDRHHTLAAAIAPLATYEDAPGSSVFYDEFEPGADNLDLWNEVIASAQEYDPLGVTGGNQVVEFPGSQLQYGKRTYPTASGLLTTSDADALSFAQYIGLRYSQPLPRIQSITLKSTTNNGGNLTEMLGRGLWDKVLVIYHGMVGGTALSQAQLIEGIEHTVSPGLWTTTFRLAPADPNTYLVLGDSTRGQLAGTGSTAANRLAF